ncbi:50S ribosomal protein L24 [Candidatus Peregrinibacteria bacterium RIFOXYC2_FULL_33_13]|nr:MAG: 50S ribosomal protein L24 [Candidatus Peregrinibacteria bacterium GW2011_GWA2_33_10]KKP40744.1 MAG: 50S ribosomal protein L24, large subunit ribosomal protein L24 [Candidatus Peregrinibacteria bacterium GW2011_GWC2_33_13]OGJ55453.1 MAG: 50S ribosomal protein L24 [Candidatus Peregrinibacteria bacterium RIFOXYC2_FULL_33_13]
MKVKANDNVLVIAGKEQGKTGKVIKTYKKANKLTIEKINIRTKHIKKTNIKAGERIRYEAPINASNVKVICPSCSKATRIGYKIGEDKKKKRFCKKCEKLFTDEIELTAKSKAKK